MSRVLYAVLAATLVLAACSGDDDAAEPSASSDGPRPSESADEVEDLGEDDEEEEEEDGPRSPLTGLPVDEDLLELPMLQVKIENSPQARPQSGLEAADVVYEEVVEGGVTRFYAIFHTELPELAGPIRSARPIDTQLMAGYGRSGFAYSGARDEVRAMLSETPSVRFTEGGAGFFRDPARSAPHNLYIDATLTYAELLEQEPDPVGDVGWVFDERPPGDALTCDDATASVDGTASDGDPPADADTTSGDSGDPGEQESGDATAGDGPGGSTDAGSCDDPGASVSVDMSLYFTTGWEYDEEEGLYRRFQDGQDFEVTGPDAVGAANVVVLATRHYVGDSGYPETDVTTDEAPAVILRDGNRYDATWTKPTPDDHLEVWTDDGDPFPLKPGPTWVLLPDADDLPTLRD